MKNFLKDCVGLLANPVIKRIHSFKDRHKGESCYLFGDGVSLKWFDLGVFNDKQVIPCNFLPFHNDFKKLNVRYLSLAEPWWFLPYERTPHISKNSYFWNPRQKYYREVIDANPDKTFFLNLSNYPLIRKSNIIYTYRDFHDSRLEKDFITEKINSFHGSLRFLVTLAIYMGFDSCFLVGFDYTHVPSRSLHWYEKGEGIYYAMQEFNKDFFRIAREHIDITTITLDGGSDILNSISYREFSGLEPRYRENIELMSDKHLQAMAAWPGYKVF